MPRALDPILQAGLENNTGSPIIRVHIARIDAATFTSNEVLYYKLSNLEVKIKLAPFEFSISSGNSYVRIERGLLIDGVEYTVFSSWYIVRTIGITYYETTIEAHLFSINNISTPGDVAANTVLAAVIAQTDVAHHTNTISYLANAEWWKTIQFLQTGRQLILDKADHITSLMRQKYLVAMNDIGENKVLLIGASYDSQYPDTIADHFLTYPECAAFEYNLPRQSKKYYVWRDESNSIHYSGTPTDPLYNLGFIPSTATPILDGFSNKALFAILSPPRLDICNGDYCNITLPFDYTAVEMHSRVLTDEIFDPRAKFVWRMELQAIEWLSNTEAGPLPGTIMQIAAYTPLVTTGFDKNLTPTVNNLQALAEAVDELDLSEINNFSIAAQTPTAATRTYIIGSKIAVPPGKLQIGTIFRWTFDMTKTAAGIAASTFDIAFGITGTITDTARVSFAKPAGSAAADDARIVIEAIVRGPLSASGIVAGHFHLTHNLAATGHAIIPCVDVTTISAAFDVTVANLFVGICITSGAADAITIQQIMTEVFNL